MTQFFQRAASRTTAVRQVWLLAALAMSATAVVLWLMVEASNRVRVASEELSRTQEAMHKMAVSLDMRLADVQNEQAGWLSSRPPQLDDTAIKLDESLTERFHQVRSAAHLAVINTNLLELEASVRGLKQLTEDCRAWHHDQTNNAVRLAAARGRLTDLFQRLANELGRERLGEVRFEVQEKLFALTLMVNRLFQEQTVEAMAPYRATLLPAGGVELLAALGRIPAAQGNSSGMVGIIAEFRSVLPGLLFAKDSGGQASESEQSLHGLCLRRLELALLRSDLQQQSFDRIGEIRFNSVDLQIEFDELQRKASVAASMEMRRTAQNLLWFGLIIGFVFLVLAVRIAGTLREQLNTIQRNGVELDRAATEARAAADSLIRSEQRTRLIVDTAMDAVVSMDDQGQILAWNKQAEQTFGWTAEEILGKSLADCLIPTRLRQAHNDGMRRFLRTGESKVLNQRVEVPALCKDGREIPVELSITPIVLAGQTSFSAFLRDISDRKAAEREILRSKEHVEAVNQRLQASLETAERLAVEAQSANTAKSEFLATMSHEIRTPMNGILGFTDLLIDTPLNEEQRDYISTIKGSADALLAIINDILDFSKVEAGKMQLDPGWFELNGVVNDVTRLLSAQASARNLTLKLECGDRFVPRVFADAARVRQVLLNLTGNALKFTEKGGVTIRLELDPERSGDDPDLKPFVRVSVMDTGIGIPLEKQAHVFEKFMQADSSHSRRYGGTGLGLAICKRLIELMGGAIGFESQPGRGSTFWFTLRCEVPTALPTYRNSTPVSSAVLSTVDDGLSGGEANFSDAELERLAGRRVLLADDNRANQVLVSTLLRKMRLQVDIATNGRECFGRIRDHSYALVLMDCHMPEMDGFEATAEIRKWETSARSISRLPILALTASLMDEDKRRCELAGMDDFLGKPIQHEELLRAIRRWILERDEAVKAP